MEDAETEFVRSGMIAWVQGAGWVRRGWRGPEEGRCHPAIATVLSAREAKEAWPQALRSSVPAGAGSSNSGGPTWAGPSGGHSWVVRATSLAGTMDRKAGGHPLPCAPQWPMEHQGHLCQVGVGCEWQPAHDHSD